MQFASAAEEKALRDQAVELTAAYVRRLPLEEPKPLAVETAREAPLVDPVTSEDLGTPLPGIVDLMLEGEGGSAIKE